jgi:hypothetical protein
MSINTASDGFLSITLSNCHENSLNIHENSLNIHYNSLHIQNNPSDTKVDIDDSQNICPICLDAMNVLPHVQTRCCHDFHISCLNKWKETKMECPVCRADITPISKKIAYCVKITLWTFVIIWVITAYTIMCTVVILEKGPTEHKALAIIGLIIMVDIIAINIVFQLRGLNDPGLIRVLFHIYKFMLFPYQILLFMLLFMYDRLLIDLSVFAISLFVSDYILYVFYIYNAYMIGLVPEMIIFNR